MCVCDYAVGGWNLSVLLDAFTILLLPLPLFFSLLFLSSSSGRHEFVVVNNVHGHYYHCESYCLTPSY